MEGVTYHKILRALMKIGLLGETPNWMDIHLETGLCVCMCVCVCVRVLKIIFHCLFWEVGCQRQEWGCVGKGLWKMWLCGDLNLSKPLWEQTHVKSFIDPSLCCVMQVGIMRTVKSSVILQVSCCSGTPVVMATEWEDPTLANINHPISCDHI